MAHPVNRDESPKENPARPVDLPLAKIRFPVSALVSIVHRVTGVLLAVIIPLLIYGLQRSLSGPTGFREIADAVASTPGRVCEALVLLVFVQHFFSGIRHLLLDLRIGVARPQSRRSAWVVFLATLLVAFAVGVGVFL